MRLRDLDAQFFGNVNVARRSHMRQGDRIEGAQGVVFQCPKCAAGKPIVIDEDGTRGVAGAHYVMVCFANPRNAPIALPQYDGNPRWVMSGSGIDDLTLSPSINLDVPENEGGCGWHGHVTKGDAA